MDLNTTAYRIVKGLTEDKDEAAEKKKQSRSSAGKAGGRQRADALSAERKREIARQASRARWLARSQ